MELNKISKEHIIEAIEKIDQESINIRKSGDYEVVFKGRNYPPKEVMRIANLLTNGADTWNADDEATNEFLKDAGFAVVEITEKLPNSIKEEKLISSLIKIYRNEASVYFDWANKLITKLQVKENDTRISYGTDGNGRLSITIGQRYCLAFIPNSELPWQFIHGAKMRSTDDIAVTKFDGSPEAYTYSCARSEEMIQWIDEIAEASKKELTRTRVSGFRKHSNAFFEKAVFDTNYRNEIFSAAFEEDYQLTGTVWKLGCNWGKNKPVFYDMIKDHSIVIGVDDKLYSPGDLVVITKGYTVYAVGKVLELPKPVTDMPEFQSEFAQYEIEYIPNVNCVQAEWYELAEDEIFTYEMQKGICKVNMEGVRNKAISIWNDRFINYWIFQCNPDEYDFEKAVKSNLLHNWTIAVDKDKIRKGDKVIIWLTGKRAGCYALARITSLPIELSTSLDNQLWKSVPKVSLKAGIEITHNLLDKPLLWQNIKEIEAVKDLKVGNQGTNFTATNKQFKTILKLIEERSPDMRNKINLSINTILYGPPGTGKTYKLKEYMEAYFTDKGIVKSSEEVLTEKVAPFQLWKVLGAVLITSHKPLTIKEIIEHRLVKAKEKPSNKTNLFSLVRRELLSYATDESTGMNEKYRRPIPLFHKGEEKTWSIAEDKKEELENSIGEELLSIAATHGVLPEQGSASKTRYNFITFHQKYSYEDFIEGIRPVLRNDAIEEEQAGDLQFELKNGMFYNSCLEALKLAGYDSFDECHKDSVVNRISRFEAVKNDSSKQFALFIDEINRANISAVFGELITLLEDDKRIGAENEIWVRLPYSNKRFCVPPNLYLIGTMNTADRSIAMLDIALRRRFEFKALYPLYIESEWWASLLEMMNQAIYNWKKNPDFFIGHAFFINKLESDKLTILNTKIIPLLYEYSQNNADIVKRLLSDAGIKIKQSGIRENFQIIAE